MPLQVVDRISQPELSYPNHVSGGLLKGLKYFASGDSNPPEITLKDYENGCDNFRKQLSHKDQVLLAPDRMVDWSTLSGIMSANGGYQLLAVYHGLNGATLEHGFRPLKLSGKDYVPTLEGLNVLPSHHLSPNGEVVPLRPEHNWPKYQRDYFADMRVIRTNPGNPSELNYKHDPKCVVFPWVEEVKLMYETNLGLQPSAKLFLANYSSFHDEPREGVRSHDGPNGYRHAICFYAHDGMAPMLLTYYISPYYYRGTDLGHLCPPRCRRTDAEGHEE